MSKIWVDNRHPSYYSDAFKRQFARDQFTGDALLVSQQEAGRMVDPAPGAGVRREYSNFMDISGIPGRKRLSEVEIDLGYGVGDRGSANGTYLRRRSLGESADAFRERASITRFPSHMPALIETYVGGLNAVESDAVREYGDPLGDPTDPSSVFFRMWHDIDGTGRNMPAAYTKVKTDLIVDDVVWAFTELGSAEYPRVHLIDPNRIVDQHDKDGIPVWVLIHETRLQRNNFHEPATVVDMFTEYHTEGWARWRVDVAEDGVRSITLDDAEDWAYPFYSTPDKDRKRLPFTRARLSDVMGRYVGFQMAMDHNMLYNLLSDARWNFRVINHPRLRLEEGDKKQFEDAMEMIGNGANGLLGKWSFISPDSSNGAEAYKVFAEEVKQFYVTNHQRMNSPSIERSATEIAYDEASGRTSFLSIMTDIVDELENDTMFIASQLMAPNNPESWLNARVKRSRNFRPIDINSLASSQSTSLAGLLNHLDAGTAARIAQEGITKETIERLDTVGRDIIVEEEL